jgi:hypothetical protein
MSFDRKLLGALEREWKHQQPGDVVFEECDGGGKRDKTSMERITRRQNKNKNRNHQTETKEVVRNSEYEVYVNNIL